MASQKSNHTGKTIKPVIQPTKIKKKTKSLRPSKPIFKGCVFSFSGDFNREKVSDNGESINEGMIRWVTAHAGQYVSEVNDETTHLICTIKDYQKNSTQVKKANSKGCWIVNYTWLEDCLIGTTKAHTKKRLSEKAYTLESLNKHRASFEGGVRAADDLVGNRESPWDVYNSMLKNDRQLGLHHIYLDQTGFEYKVDCVRINDCGQAGFEKYTIYLFESNAKPHHYMAGAKLVSSKKGGHKTTSYWREECHPKAHFSDAFKDFRMFFREKTGIEWDDRLDKGQPQIPDPFKYDLPTKEKPVGLLPPGKMHPAAMKAKLKAEKDEIEMEAERAREIDMSNSDDSGVGLADDTDTEMDDDSELSTSSPRSTRANSVISISSDSEDSP